MMQNETVNNPGVKTAKIVSYLFHPLFIPVYGLLIVFFAPTLFWYMPFRVKEILFFIFVINNILIPVSLIPLFRYRHIISSVAIEERKERTIPLITVSLLYIVTSVIMYSLQIPVFLKAYSYSLSALSLVLLLINLRWKISLYSAAAGAFTALVMILSIKMSFGLPGLIILSFIFSGVIISSRLLLNAHRPAEVYPGFITGFFVIAGGLLLLQ
jgi:hypothetical protein